VSNPYRATPEQWESLELYAEDNVYDACFLELRARIEALEAAQPHQDKLDRLIMGSPLDADDGDPIVMPSSPAAQAIWDAWNDAYEAQGPLEDMGQPIAAALRAAADQIAPTKQNYSEASDFLAATCLNGMAYAANKLRLIAAELEGRQ